MADEPTYYVLRVEDPEVGYRARLVYERDTPLRSWMSGAHFEQAPPEPIVIKLRGTDEEDWVLGDLWLTPITVMSTRVFDALRGAGVDNLDTYAVELHDPQNGAVHKDFVAFNIVGKIAAADLAGTQFAPSASERMISADIDSLAIDPKKTRGALMFRLAESVNAIIVHDSVRKAVLAAGIDTLTFLEPQEWAG
jgi:predicted HicB family RNase H-like nuclease